MCNGDFENYILNSTTTYDSVFQLYSLFKSDNTSCWYASACGYIEVLKTKYGTGTKATTLKIFLTCQLSICQNVNLTVGSRYNLSFDVTGLPLMQNATAYAYLNGKRILTIINNNYLEISHGFI